MPKYASARVTYPCDAYCAAAGSKVPPSEPLSTNIAGRASEPSGRNRVPITPSSLISRRSTPWARCSLTKSCEATVFPSNPRFAVMFAGARLLPNAPDGLSSDVGIIDQNSPA